jgi:hypothetical protein
VNRGSLPLPKIKNSDYRGKEHLPGWKPASGALGTLSEQLAIGLGIAEPRRTARQEVDAIRGLFERIVDSTGLNEQEAAAVLASIPAAILPSYCQASLRRQFDEQAERLADQEGRLDNAEQVLVRLVVPSTQHDLVDSAEVA